MCKAGVYLFVSKPSFKKENIALLRLGSNHFANPAVIRQEPKPTLPAGKLTRRVKLASQVKNALNLKDQVSRCLLCRTPRSSLYETRLSSSSWRPSSEKRLVSALERLAPNCRRCDRHFLIYGLPWPYKKLLQKVISLLSEVRHDADG